MTDTDVDSTNRSDGDAQTFENEPITISLDFDKFDNNIQPDQSMSETFIERISRHPKVEQMLRMSDEEIRILTIFSALVSLVMIFIFLLSTIVFALFLDKESRSVILDSGIAMALGIIIYFVNITLAFTVRNPGLEIPLFVAAVLIPIGLAYLYVLVAFKDKEVISEKTEEMETK